MTVELRHLRMLLVLADEGHITRAAEKLGTQQPALSQRLQAMERSLDLKLFHRKTRGIEVTEAGALLLRHARALLADYDAALEAAKRVQRGEQGKLRIGIPPTAPFHPLVPTTIRKFREAFPLVDISMEELLRTELLQGLRSNAIDVAFVRAPLAAEDGLVVQPLSEEPLLIALPTGHSLLRTHPKKLKGRQLAQETFIPFARQLGPAFYEETLAFCLRAGFSPRWGQDAPRITSALSLVAAGLGAALVPASMRRVKLEGVAYREIADANPPRAYLRIAFRKDDKSRAVSKFAQLVRQVANASSARS